MSGDRRGRGFRGPLAWPPVPAMRSRSAQFDELVLDLMAAGTPPRVHRFDGYWLDIGRPDDYDRANEDWATLRDTFLPDR